MPSKTKIKRITPVGTRGVCDISVADVSHYITADGTVHHNSGIVYSASIIMNLAKAKLKDNDGSQTGIIVTAKPDKNRFAVPHTVRFHISYNHGMNAYVGLEEYVLAEDSWDKYGVGRGKFITDKEYAKLPASDKEKARQHPLDGKLYYLYSASARNMCNKESTEPIPFKELFSPRVFTQGVLEAIDETVKAEYAYSGYADPDAEVDAVLSGDGEV